MATATLITHHQLLFFGSGALCRRSYSKANVEKGITWGEDTLYEYLVSIPLHTCLQTQPWLPSRQIECACGPVYAHTVSACRNSCSDTLPLCPLPGDVALCSSPCAAEP